MLAHPEYLAAFAGCSVALGLDGRAAQTVGACLCGEASAKEHRGLNTRAFLMRIPLHVAHLCSGHQQEAMEMQWNVRTERC